MASSGVVRRLGDLDARKSFAAGVEAVRWAVRMPSERELYGELQSNGRAIELDSDVLDAAEFARWVRAQIPRTTH